MDQHVAKARGVSLDASADDHGSFPEQIGVLHCRRMPQTTHEFYEKMAGDKFEMRIALRRERVTLACNGEALYQGWVLPGMIRLLSPDEDVHGVLHTSSDTVAIQIPGGKLRTALQAASPNHRRGKVSFVDALLQSNPQAEQLGRMALQANTYDPVHAELLLDGIVHALFACLLHHHGTGELKRASKEKFTLQELDQIIDFAEAHLAQTLTLEAWAKAVQMEAGKFVRKFRLTVGSSPYNWFLGRRIERSKELLSRLDLPLCQVALSVGFTSQSHFTDVFRRRTGTTPLCWRQRHVP